jgi:hypothetical protein
MPASNEPQALTNRLPLRRVGEHSPFPLHGGASESGGNFVAGCHRGRGLATAKKGRSVDSP